MKKNYDFCENFENMEKIHFKTNLNCNGCVSKVKNDLDMLIGENLWNVDTENPNKVLSIPADKNPEKVEEIVKNKGFLIEQL